MTDAAGARRDATIRLGTVSTRVEVSNGSIEPAPALSVIIPTYNRIGSLLRVLDEFEAQRVTVEGGAEVIVVDDGSTDGTADALRERWHGKPGWICESRPNAGPAAARNRGAHLASGEILLFTCDDIEPCPGFLTAHQEAHRSPGSRPLAVLGYTEWDPARMRVTPFLVHLNEYGYQFAYSNIEEREDPEDLPAHKYFYSSNVSLPREFLLSLGGFDERFPEPAFDDLEFAYRAQRVEPPLRLVFRREAHALHDQPTDAGSAIARLPMLGRAAAQMLAKHPDSSEFIRTRELEGWQPRRPFRIAAMEKAIRVLDPRGIPLPTRVYDPVLHWHYLNGLSQGMRTVATSTRPVDDSVGA